jgi:predicted AAA+ superfamily ATPase
LDKCPNAIEHINPQGFSPEIELPGSKWSTMIKTARDAVLALRGQHLPVNEKGEPLEAYNFNNVVVQDISYLRKNFKAEQHEKQKIIDNTVIEYMLNNEQERAFRIVANHATMAKPSQLKMYLGGMGGTGKSQVIKALTAFFEK